MSIPNEALQKLLQEIETRAIASQQQIALTKAQLTGKQRDIRLLELTSKELSSFPRETRVYEGVGKMFVGVPMPAVEKRLASEAAELKGDVSKLEKKLHYHETTLNSSRSNMEQILRTSARA